MNIKVIEPKIILDGEPVYMNDNQCVTTEFIKGRFVGYANPSVKTEMNKLRVVKNILEIIKPIK